MREEKIFKKFPLLFREVKCFEFDKGWLSLIYKAASKLEPLIKALPKEEQKECFATQTKEKFGSLKLYMSGATDEMDNVIKEAEEESMVTCEICGKAGKQRDIGAWIKTLCSKCYSKEKIRHSEHFSSRKGSKSGAA
jgi:hypothetical protein